MSDASSPRHVRHRGAVHHAAASGLFLRAVQHCPLIFGCQEPENLACTLPGDWHPFLKSAIVHACDFLDEPCPSIMTLVDACLGSACLVSRSWIVLLARGTCVQRSHIPAAWAHQQPPATGLACCRAVHQTGCVPRLCETAAGRSRGRNQTAPRWH